MVVVVCVLTDVDGMGFVGKFDASLSLSESRNVPARRNTIDEEEIS